MRVLQDCGVRYFLNALISLALAPPFSFSHQDRLARINATWIGVLNYHILFTSKPHISHEKPKYLNHLWDPAHFTWYPSYVLRSNILHAPLTTHVWAQPNPLLFTIYRQRHENPIYHFQHMASHMHMNVAWFISQSNRALTPQEHNVHILCCILHKAWYP